MPKQQRTLTSDEWPTKRELAARCLALGMTQQKSADEAGVNITTVQRWLLEESYIAHVDELRRYGFQRIEEEWIGGLRLAIATERQVYNREISPDDPVYREARQRIERFERFLVAGTPAGQGGNPPPAVAVQFVNNNGHSDAAIPPPTDVTPEA